MTYSTRFSSMVSAAIALAFTSAHAQNLTINFDDGTTNPFGVGTISSDQAQSGSYSLQLGGDDSINYTLPSEFQGKALSITFQIFDEGRWVDDGSTDMGPRWGVGATASAGEYVAAGIVNLGYIDSGFGYATPNSNEDFVGQYSGNTWYGATWFDYNGDRTDGSNPPVAASAPFMSETPDGSTGVGQWFEWSYETTADGLVTWSNSGGATTYSDVDVGGAISQLLFFGGDTGDLLSGAYIDSISVTVVPEPSAWALIATVGFGAVLLHRRRRLSK